MKPKLRNPGTSLDHVTEGTPSSFSIVAPEIILLHFVLLNLAMTIKLFLSLFSA